MDLKQFEGHTPGKWSERAIYWLLRFGRKHSGAWDEVPEKDGNLPDDKDSKLIAAAPDLLEYVQRLEEALKNLIKTIKEPINTEHYWNDVGTDIRYAEAVIKGE